MEDIEWRLISEFLIDHIPLILDMKSKDLKYDSRSMYYKIYKYIIKLRGDNNGERWNTLFT